MDTTITDLPDEESEESTTTETAETETPASTERADETKADDKADDEEKKFTQSDVNKLIEKRLATQKAKLFKDEVDPLKAELSTVEELKTRAAEAVAKRDDYKTQLEAKTGETLRLSVALDKGLPFDLISRLQGSTTEELEADAETLLGFVKAKPTGDFGGGARPKAETPVDTSSWLMHGLEAAKNKK